MEAKKIICTVTTDPNYDQRMQRICSALQEGDYNVLLIGRILPHSVDLNEKTYQQKRLNNWFKTGFLFYAEHNLRLFFYLLFTRFDILCAIDLDTILPGYLVSKIKGKPFVHDAHELFTEMPELDENPTAKSVWNLLEKWIFPTLKHAYTESEGYKEVYKEKYPNTTFEVFQNVPRYYSTQRNVDDGEYILYQGALNQGRGLEVAIEAMKSIDYPFWIAGSGSEVEKLKQQVQEDGLEEKVKFLGVVSPEDLVDITKKAKIGLNLLDPTNRHYQLSFPNKLFDYIMAELPQVSMNFPFYQKITNGKSIGILIDDLEVDTVKNAIQELLNNEQLYRDSIQGCRELKEIHNWENEKDALLEFYNQLS